MPIIENVTHLTNGSVTNAIRSLRVNNVTLNVTVPTATTNESY